MTRDEAIGAMAQVLAGGRGALEYMPSRVQEDYRAAAAAGLDAIGWREPVGWADVVTIALGHGITAQALGSCISPDVGMLPDKRDGAVRCALIPVDPA